MSKTDKPDLGHLFEHQPDSENGFCELCEASSIASVVLPHAMALGERSEISLLLMAAELAAQAIEGISHADGLDADLVLAAVTRRVQELRSDRIAEGSTPEGLPSSRVRH